MVLTKIFYIIKYFQYLKTKNMKAKPKESKILTEFETDIKIDQPFAAMVPEAEPFNYSHSITEPVIIFPMGFIQSRNIICRNFEPDSVL